MKKVYRYLWILFLLLFAGLGTAQEYHFGIRAGLSYAKFLGPAEPDVTETFDINSGFHFGVVGLLELNDYFSVGAEILYNQSGAKYFYEGESYYRMYVGDVDTVRDHLIYDLEITNSYINVPIMIHFQPTKKLEFILGGYMGFLVNPVAGGKYDFGSRFIQYPEYNYYSDKAGGGPYGAQYDILNVKVPQPDGTVEITQLFKTPGAYYQYTSSEFNNDTGKFFNWFDLGLTGGVQYFINRSLYAGIRVEYGLLDISNDRLDRSLKDLDADGKFILRDDKDTNINFQVSLGFRF